MTVSIAAVSASSIPSPQSATSLLRSLKSAQGAASTERIAIAQSALSGTAVPRIKELLRQWVLDEWLSPYKGIGRPPILQQEYHDLYQLLGDDGSPPPFAILLRSFAELREYGVNVHEAPTKSLKRMLALQNQYVPLGRWIELWSAMVHWVAGDRNTGSTGDHVRELNDIIFQRMIEHRAISQDDPTVKSALLTTLPQLSVLHQRHPNIVSYLIQTLAEVMLSLPPDALDRFLEHSVTPEQHAAILGILPSLLKDLARVRSRQRQTFFLQPTSSEITHDAYVAQSLHNAIYEEFQQISAFIDGVAALGSTSTEGILRTRLSCWRALRELDVRMDGDAQWLPLLSKAARAAQAMLSSGDESNVRVSLALLACLSELDYQAAAVSEQDIKMCLQPRYIRSTEGVELLSALAMYHRLVRRPADYVEIICRSLSSFEIRLDADATSVSLPETFISDLHDLVHNGGAADECWRHLLQTSGSVLSSIQVEGDLRLLLLANIVASLVSQGCSPSIRHDVASTWILQPSELSTQKRGNPSNRTRLTSILTVRSTLHLPDTEARLALMRYLAGRSLPTEHDITLTHYLLSSPSVEQYESDLIEELLDRLARQSSRLYWRSLDLPVLQRIQSRASDGQLARLGNLITANPSRVAHLIQSAAFWELPRLPDVIARLSADSVNQGIGVTALAVPFDLQLGDRTSRLIEGCEKDAFSVERGTLWLAQAHTDAFTKIAPEALLQLVINESLRPLLETFLRRLLHNGDSTSRLPGVLVHGIEAINTYMGITPSLTVPMITALLNVLGQIAVSGVKWSSMPTSTQDRLHEIFARSSAEMRKLYGSENNNEYAEMKAQAWVDARRFSLWSELELDWNLPHAVLTAVSGLESANPTLALHVVALQGQEDDLLAALYETFRRRVGHATRMDDAMSTIIQASSPTRYSSLWLCAIRQRPDGTLLSLMLSTSREGSGKIVAGYLSIILAALQAGQLDLSVLVSLWQYRAILFSERQAMDAWSAFSTRVLSAKTDISLLLDAATTFCQQRSDLLPSTTLSVTSAICALFTYLRDDANEMVAQRTARFLDTLGRVGQNTKRKSGEAPSRQRISRALAPHIPVILVSYARSATNPIKGISATVRKIIDPSVAELCTSIDPSVGRAFDSIGLPYGLGEGLAGEAEAAVWASIWRSWKKKRYIGQG